MVFIDGRRSGYNPNQCRETVTVQELIDFLKEKIDYGEYDPNEPIYLRNDCGYTYGEIDIDTVLHGFVDKSGYEHFDSEGWDDCDY